MSLDTEVEALRARLLERERELEESRDLIDRLRLEHALDVERIRLHSQQVQQASQQQLEDLVAQRTNRLSLEITRRKEAERALRWSLDEIQDLYDHAPCGYHTLDDGGCYLRVNQTELKWLGMTSEEVLGSRFVDLLAPEDREVYGQHEATLASDGQVSDVQLTLTPRDGRRMTIRLSAAKSAPWQGPHVTRAMFIDVSARFQAEDALRRHQVIIEAVLEGTTDAVYVKDLQGRYLMVNSAGARLLGKEVEDVLGKDDWEMFSPDTAKLIREGDERIMLSGVAKTFEEYGTSAGFRRRYNTMKGPYRDPQGRVIGLIGISRVISESPE